MTEPSVLQDQGCGTVYRAMSMSVRHLMFFVENSNISFLVCLSRDIECFFCFSHVDFEVLLRPR